MLCSDVLSSVSSMPSIASQRTCQFWARGEHVNMTKTVDSPAKCDVHAVIRFLYSEQVTRKIIVTRNCPSSWQRSVAHCSCNKKVPAAFSMGSVWSPPYSPDVVLSDFHLYSDETVSRRTAFCHRHWAADQCRELMKAQATGFYDEVIGK